MKKCAANELNNCIRIQFAGEAVVDEGGPRNEFFSLTHNELSKPGMFTGEESRKCFNHYILALEQRNFYIYGELCYMAIVQGSLSPCFFAPAVVDYIVYGKIEKVETCIDDVPNQNVKQKLQEFATSRLKTRVVSRDKKSRNADTSTSRYVENMVKRCAWGTCRNDSRFPHLQNKNKNGDPLKFFRFPAPKCWKEAAERRKRWIVACHRGDGFECKKDSYICSLHFVGENGPTSEHPDPISAITSKEKVC